MSWDIRSVESSLLFIPLLPFVGALILRLFGRALGKPNVSLVACASIFGSFVVSLLILVPMAFPAVAGKPNAAMADMIRDRYGSSGWVAGDRPDTDGRFARALGYRFALVLSGVTNRSDLPVRPEPDRVADNLSALVDDVLGAAQ